jgi:hypothetical protein
MAFVPGSMNNFGPTIRTSTRTIFKIWRRQSAGNENKIPVTIRITELRFFAGYAAKKWPPFGAAEALFQELRARRENELKLVLVLLLVLELDGRHKASA